MLKMFIILGPDGNDGVPMHWNRKTGVWVESGVPCDATLYSRAEVFEFPPSQLPVGAGAIMNIATGMLSIPYPPGGMEESWK